jgi:Asp-tRNA(Asn)/Glu-tRNA(Gln) amidotransferase C subunit
MRNYVESMDLLLDLQLKDQDIDEVVQNFETITAMARLVNEFPLPENIEPAPVFEP